MQFYIGGQWMAKYRVLEIELYNEPDKDDCINAERFIDDIRIRASAIRQAFEDYLNGLLDPVLIAPTTAGGYDSRYSPILMDKLYTTFPDDGPTTVPIADAYAFHKYGGFSEETTSAGQPCDSFRKDCRPERGYGVRSRYDQAVDSIAASGKSFSKGVYITEFNCYTGALADSPTHPYFKDNNVMDEPVAAACLAAQVAGLFTKEYSSGGAPLSINAFKFVQTRSSSPTSPSKIAKNGV